jgi:uncharacterized membrane protein
MGEEFKEVDRNVPVALVMTRLTIPWGTPKLLRISIALHLAWLGSLGSSAMDLPLGSLAPLFGFIFLVLVPGLVVMRVFRMYHLNPGENLVYSVGSSVALLMTTGLVLNQGHAIWDLANPLTSLNLALAVTLVMAVLYILALIRGRNEQLDEAGMSSAITPSRALWMPAIGFAMLPIVAVVGSYVMESYNSNSLLLLLILLSAVVPIILTLRGRAHPALYPLAIFSIAVSLLLHTSLVSPYLVGSDVHAEYYYSMSVQEKSYWDPNDPHNLNSVLSTTILPAIFSNLMNVDQVHVYKVVFPIIYALVPLGLYFVFRRNMKETEAFLSVFFFMSIFTFYTEMTGLARQQIAELFAVLILSLAFAETKGDQTNRRILFILFGFGLVVSHYGLAVIFAISLVLFSIIAMRKVKLAIMGPNSIALLGVMMIAWYMYIATASPLQSFVQIGQFTVDNLQNLLDPYSREVVVFISRQELTPLLQVIKVVNMVAQFLIALGLLELITTMARKRKYTNLSKRYVVLSLSFACILLAAVVIPGLANRLNIYRLYHIALLVLSPFCILGMRVLVRTIASLLRSRGLLSRGIEKETTKVAIVCASVLLASLLLLNTGFVQEVSGDMPTSISLDRSAYTLHYHTEVDDEGVKWMKNNLEPDSVVWGSKGRGSQVLVEYFYPTVQRFTGDTKDLNGYVFLGHNELQDGVIIASFSYDWSNPRDLIEFSSSEVFSSIESSGNKVYDTGGSAVYSMLS